MAAMATQTGPDSAGTPALSDLAPAKVNLSLEILGRRADGYHELASLVAFADAGDTLHLSPATDRDITLATTGPFASAIDGDNLILRAARLFLDHAPQACGGHFVLDKRLPVASGIGGGSSDAAAAIRLMARANAWGAPDCRAALIPALSRLGADIPVCLDPRAAWMQGIGERIAPLETCPALPAVLVNPGIPLATRDVFAALNAPALVESGTRVDTPRRFASADELVGFLRGHPNDLERPARRPLQIVGVAAQKTDKLVSAGKPARSVDPCPRLDKRGRVQRREHVPRGERNARIDQHRGQGRTGLQRRDPLADALHPRRAGVETYGNIRAEPRERGDESRATIRGPPCVRARHQAYRRRRIRRSPADAARNRQPLVQHEMPATCLRRVVQEQPRGAQDEVIAVYCRSEWSGRGERDIAVCGGGQVEGVASIGESDEAGKFMIAVRATAEDFQRQIDLGGGQVTQRWRAGAVRARLCRHCGHRAASLRRAAARRGLTVRSPRPRRSPRPSCCRPSSRQRAFPRSAGGPPAPVRGSAYATTGTGLRACARRANKRPRDDR